MNLLYNVSISYLPWIPYSMLELCHETFPDQQYPYKRKSMEKLVILQLIIVSLLF